MSGYKVPITVGFDKSVIIGSMTIYDHAGILIGEVDDFSFEIGGIKKGDKVQLTEVSIVSRKK